MICSLTILALSIPYCPIPPYVARGFSSATLRKMSIMTKWGASSHQQVLLLLHLANALRWTIICTLLWISLPWVWQTSWQQQPAAGQRAIPLPYKSSTKHKLASRSVAQSHHWENTASLLLRAQRNELLQNVWERVIILHRFLTVCYSVLTG